MVVVEEFLFEKNSESIRYPVSMPSYIDQKGARTWEILK
jgi:hypothetical protein